MDTLRGEHTAQHNLSLSPHTSHVFKQPSEEAMKAKEPQRLAALRSMRTAFLNEMKKDGSETISDEVAEGPLRKLAKQRLESIDAFKKGGRDEELFDLGLTRVDVPGEVWRANGCEECGQSGYSGRTGIHEFMSAVHARSAAARS